MSELGTAEERAAKERRGPGSAHRGGPPHAAIGVPTDTSHIPSGTFDIKDFTDQLVKRGKIPSRSRLGQISFGVETVSTGGATRHWDFTKFTVRDS